MSAGSDIKYCTSRTHHLICGHKIHTNRVYGCGRNCQNPNGPKSSNDFKCNDCCDNDGGYLLLCEINRNDAILATLKKFGSMAYSENVEAEIRNRESAMKFRVPNWMWSKFVTEEREVFKGWLTEVLEKEFNRVAGSTSRVFENPLDPEAEKLRTELEIQQIALENYLELSGLSAIEVPENLFADIDFETTMELLRTSTSELILELGTANTRAAAVTEHYTAMYGKVPVTTMSLGQIVNLGTALRAMFDDLSHRRKPHSADTSPKLLCGSFSAVDEEGGGHVRKEPVTNNPESTEESLTATNSFDSSSNSISDSSSNRSSDSSPSSADKESIKSSEAYNERTRQEMLERVYALVGKPPPLDKARRNIEVPPQSKST